MFSAEEIRSAFRYDPETGIVYRKMKGGVEKRASFFAKLQGRNRVTYKSTKMYAYRVAWAIHFGVWPTREIDHINGDSSDDRIVNLRDVDRSTNQENLRRAKATNAIGVLGVSKSGNRFFATVHAHGNSKYLGSFMNAEDAHNAYIEAKRKYHKGCTI